MLTSDQIRAGRALVRWSARELAEQAGLSLPTVQRIEAAEEMPSTSVKTLDAIRRALEVWGVIFIPGNGDGPGVRLQRPTPPGAHGLNLKVSIARRTLVRFVADGNTRLFAPHALFRTRDGNDIAVGATVAGSPTALVEIAAGSATEHYPLLGLGDFEALPSMPEFIPDPRFRSSRLADVLRMFSSVDVGRAAPKDGAS